MNRPSNEDPRPEDLLGYVLGALETDEHEQIERKVDQDESINHELQEIQEQLAPLDGLVPPGPPPAGLARRTCEQIATFPREDVELPKRRWFETNSDMGGTRSTWSVSDFITLAVVALVLGAIILPAVNYSRFESRSAHCRNNMRQVGMALFEYSDHSGNRFVEIPQTGNRAVAGWFAPALYESGYVDNNAVFLCAGLGSQGDRRLPTCEEIDTATGPELVEIQKRMSGDIAYTLGYNDRGRYIPPRNERRLQYILLADAPSVDLPGRASRNHGGYGQNCFFEDGSVRYLATCAIDGDSIYENDFGNIAPGAHSNDNIVAPSHTRLWFAE